VAFKALVKKMRYVKDRYFKKPPLEDPDFISLGLHPHDETRSEHLVVHERVTVTLRLRYDREIIVDFRITGAPNKAKPKGYEGADIIWAILDHHPTGHAELTGGHEMASRTPFYFEFSEEDRGKTVYIAAAWQNERGHRGAYSDIVSAVVP